jgi:NADPH2:quinone reductase
VIDYTTENIVDEVKKITKGKGVPVVVDGVGKDTWNWSLDCLQPRGLMVSFGNASGAVPPVALGILNTKGSLYVTRPSLGSYTATRKALEASAKSLFKMVKNRKVKIAIRWPKPARRIATSKAARPPARRCSFPDRWCPDRW